MSEYIGNRKQSKARCRSGVQIQTCLCMLLMPSMPLQFEITAKLRCKTSPPEEASLLDPWQALNWPY